MLLVKLEKSKKGHQMTRNINEIQIMEKQKQKELEKMEKQAQNEARLKDVINIKKFTKIFFFFFWNNQIFFFSCKNIIIFSITKKTKKQTKCRITSRNSKLNSMKRKIMT